MFLLFQLQPTHSPHEENIIRVFWRRLMQPPSTTITKNRKKISKSGPFEYKY